MEKLKCGAQYGHSKKMYRNISKLYDRGHVLDIFLYGLLHFTKNNIFMKTNVVNADRIIRTLMALTFIVLFFTNILPLGVAYLFLVFAVILLVTGFTGFCPIYWLFGHEGKEKRAH